MYRLVEQGKGGGGGGGGRRGQEGIGHTNYLDDVYYMKSVIIDCQ